MKSAVRIQLHDSRLVQGWQIAFGRGSVLDRVREPSFRVFLFCLIVTSCVMSSMVASRADASEMVSPSYLWDPVNSFSISRILICGDHPEKIDYHHGDFPKGPRLALYRNMSSQYFTTREEDSLNYDMPLNMEMVEDNEKFQRIVFTQSDESGAQKPYAELKVFPHGNPIWIRYDSKDHHRIEDKCRGYRFQAEFIHRG